MFLLIFDRNWLQTNANVVNSRPTVTTTLRNLIALYRKQGRNEAADQLDNCAVKIKKDPSAITQAIEVVQKVQMSESAMASPQTLTSSQSSNNRFSVAGGPIFDSNSRNLNEVLFLSYFIKN